MRHIMRKRGNGQRGDGKKMFKGKVGLHEKKGVPPKRGLYIHAPTVTTYNQVLVANKRENMFE